MSITATTSPNAQPRTEWAFTITYWQQAIFHRGFLFAPQISTVREWEGFRIFVLLPDGIDSGDKYLAVVDTIAEVEQVGKAWIDGFLEEMIEGEDSTPEARIYFSQVPGCLD